MSRSTFTRIFEGRQNEMEEMIDVKDDLLSQLESYDVITNLHRRTIEVTLLLFVLNQFFDVILCVMLGFYFFVSISCVLLIACYMCFSLLVFLPTV